MKSSPRNAGVTVLLWGVVCAQALQALSFVVMGLGWGGVLYTANVVQGGVLFVVACFLAARRSVTVLLVPVLSFVLSWGLQEADERLTMRACSPEAKAAIVELGPAYIVDDGDPSLFSLDFPSGCSTIFSSPNPEAVVLQEYRQAGQNAGWEVARAGPTNDRVELSREQWTVVVQPYRDEDGLFELVLHQRR